MIDTPIPHYILAGGQSRRFGSDKARHAIDGTPMLVRVRDAFAEIASPAYAVARQPNAYRDLGVDTIADTIAGLGPLGGLLTALIHLTGSSPDPSRDTPSWLLMSSCDLADPFTLNITPLLQRVTPAVQASVFRGAKFFEPFPGLYRSDLLPTVQQRIATSDHSMQGLLRSLGERTHAHPLMGAGDAPIDLDA